MESPVRIKLALGAITILFLIEHSSCYPFKNVTSYYVDDTSQEQTTISNLNKIVRDNTLLDRRRNTTHSLLHPTIKYKSNSETTVRNNPTSSGETTTGTRNNVYMRGSAKFFSQRPTYTPKPHNFKSTTVKSDVHDKSNITKSINPKKSEPNSYKSPFRRKNSTESNVSTDSHDVENVTRQTVHSYNDDVTPIPNNKIHNRVDGGKSFNDFNIDRYTSPEFHDVNNVYSQSVSPEIEHFIVPENASDFYVSVGSAPNTQQFNNYFTKSYSAELTTPKTKSFDYHYNKVMDSVKQNFADSEYSNDYVTEKPLNKFNQANFDDLLTKANNNDTKLSYKNIKEITLTNSEDSKNKHKDYTNSDDTKLLFVSSEVSTKSYDVKSSTSRILKENSQEIDKPTTLSPVASNEIIHQNNNDIRRIDNLKTNETHKENVNIPRMRPRPTQRPRIRMSPSGNIVVTPTTASTIRRISSTARTPTIIRTYNRKRTNNFTTVASKIDPNYQIDNSPTRMSEHSKTESDNYIPTITKRGSTKYGTNRTRIRSNSAESNEDELLPQYSTNSQWSIPSTAISWSLTSMTNTPTNKKLDNKTHDSNLQNQETIITKSDDDLQILDKNSNTGSNNTTLYEKVPTISTAKENNTFMNYENIRDEFTSASRLGYTTIVRPRDNKIYNKTINDNNVINSVETKSNLDIITTPLYESQDSNQSASEDDNYKAQLMATLLNQMNGAKNLATQKDKTTLKYERIIPTTIYTTVKTTTPEDDDDLKYTTTMFSSKVPYDTTVTSSDFVTNKPQSKYDDMEITTAEKIDPVNSRNPEFDTESIELDITTNPPITITNPPIITTNPPITTTNPPITTTNPPITTTNPPITTTNPPITTTNLPNTPTIGTTTERTTTPTYHIVKDTTTTTESSDYTTYYKINYHTTTMINNNFEDKMINNTTTEDLSNVEIIESTTDNSNYVSTVNVKRQDIESASTVYYSPTIPKTEFAILSSTTEDHTVSTTTTTRPTTVIDSDENIDSREGKKTSILDDDNSDDGNDFMEPTVDTRQLDSNEIPNTKIASDQDIENDFTDFTQIESSTYRTVESNDNQPESTTMFASNIEVIKPDLSALSPRNENEYPQDTTPLYIDTPDDGYQSTDGAGAIAAITISAIGVLALILLVGLLFVAKGRRRAGGYGQRCTPVSLDSYSLDNVSVSGSTRRKNRRPSKRSYGNPAYDESGATSHPMQFAALANFALDQDSIISEFNEIPSITVKADEVPPGCETKNRYSNVIPLPETRVMLKALPGDDTSDYINANYVRGPKGMKNYYIACQAPLASTVNDFWRMIWEQNSRVILMLTEFMENGAEKCYEYLPPSEVSDNRRIFGDFQVTVKKRDVRDKYVISIIQLKNINAHVWREVTHMWYFWPAKGVPEESNSIITFLIEARSYLKASQSAKDYDEDGHDSMVIQNGSMMNHQTNGGLELDEGPNAENDASVYNVQKSDLKIKNGGNGVMNGTDTESRKKGGPLIVHCSPGTGRTGALIACDIGIRDFEMSRTVDVPKTVYRIRRDRANAVQTKDQYIFVYKVLSEYATKLTGGILD